MALVGSDTKTFSDVHIGDTERRSGLYILGESGMGKSTLLVNLVLQDIGKGNSCFFLDPHGKAIDDILERSPHLQKRNVLMLNPTSDDRAFGINPLYCPDITSRSMRAEAENKATSIFERIFESGNKQEVWLPLILENALPVLIETGYTLAEMPFFLFNRSFREFMLKQVEYSAKTIEFWRYEFKEEQAQPAMVRVRRLLGGEYVRYIIGQQKSVIDFGSLVSGEGNVILLRLSPTLSEDARRFIGTIVVTELLTAIKGRTQQQREIPFSIFVDEFQHFATDQFAEFINEGRKFGCQVAVSHQERVGQFGENQKILGATMACANKIIFQCTVKDARELAPVFAEKPTFTDTRKIPELVICKEPMWDLLRRGHNNPRVQELFRKHLLYLFENMNEIKNNAEALQLQRSGYFDDAMLFRDEASLEGVDEKRENQQAALARGRDITVYRAALDRTETLLQQAMSQHGFAKDTLQQMGFALAQMQNHRRIIKLLDSRFTTIMEGALSPTARDEKFSDILAEAVAKGLSFYKLREVGVFYVYLMYGDSRQPRSLTIGSHTLDFVRKHFYKQAEEIYVAEHLEWYKENKVSEWDGNRRFERLPTPQELAKKAEKDRADFARGYTVRETPRFMRAGFMRSQGLKVPFDFFAKGQPDPIIEKTKVYLSGELSFGVLPEANSNAIGMICRKDLLELNPDFIKEIDECIEFCKLLAIPENHIKVPSGVYKEVAVNMASTQEMTNRAVQTLTDHPKYIASYKSIANRNGEEITEKGIMKTNDFFEGRRNYPFEPVCIGRTYEEIDQEIAERREGWRKSQEIAERREEWRKSLPRGRETRSSEEKPPPEWD